MIEPQRDLHNAQNPGVLVSDPMSFVFNGVFLVGILARHPGVAWSVRPLVQCTALKLLSCAIEHVWRKHYDVRAMVPANKLARSFNR
jgi:hypothetical protein